MTLVDDIMSGLDMSRSGRRARAKQRYGLYRRHRVDRTTIKEWTP
jgi:hypothetical protein